MEVLEVGLGNSNFEEIIIIVIMFVFLVDEDIVVINFMICDCWM